MSNDIQKRGSGILGAINNYINDLGLEDVKTSANAKTKTATITGRKDGMQYTTTIQQNSYGATKTVSQYNVNIGREAMIEQVKELRRHGYKQQEIADMLGISQASVSVYLRS